MHRYQTRPNQMINIEQEVIAAEKRIRSFIRETYLEHSIPFSQLTGAHVFLKYENLQFTGSFKVRGAMNKLLSLTEEQKKNGIVTASTGNHAAGVAYGLHKLNITGTIFVTTNAQKTKIDNIRNYGPNFRIFWRNIVDKQKIMQKKSPRKTI